MALLGLIDVTDVMPHSALYCLRHASLLLPPVNVHLSHFHPEGEGPPKDRPPHLPPVTERVEAKKNNGSITVSDANNPFMTICVGLQEIIMGGLNVTTTRAVL